LFKHLGLLTERVELKVEGDRDSGRIPSRAATSTLREVARTAPYMHDGSHRTLKEGVDFYNDGGRANPNLDAELQPLRLTALEKRQLEAFLQSLTGRVTEGL
ncbi:MAG: hypothetical protein V3S03_00880, partial [Vicinamibacteria bacterium]